MNKSANPHPEYDSSHLFGAAELARLATYRAAVTAGFYTDNCLELPASAFERANVAPRIVWAEEDMD